jgi:hypothetical protein
VRFVLFAGRKVNMFLENTPRIGHLRRLDGLRRRKILYIFKQVNFDVGVKTLFSGRMGG